MFVKSVHLNDFQNEEHYGFHTYVADLVNEFSPAFLRVDTQFNAYKQLLPDENKALDQVQKSVFTAKLDEGDRARDKPILGFFKVVKGQLHHFNPAVSAAAYGIDVINESFNGITRLPYEKETVAITKWLETIRTSSFDVNLLGAADWLNEIEAKNNAFAELKKGRFAEEDLKTNLRMKDVRNDVDDAYRAIVDRINAFITIEGDAQYAAFVNKLNNRIDSFTLTLAQRQGRNKKAAETTAK